MILVCKLTNLHSDGYISELGLISADLVSQVPAEPISYLDQRKEMTRWLGQIPRSANHYIKRREPEDIRIPLRYLELPEQSPLKAIEAYFPSKAAKRLSGLRFTFSEGNDVIIGDKNGATTHSHVAEFNTDSRERIEGFEPEYEYGPFSNMEGEQYLTGISVSDHSHPIFGPICGPKKKINRLVKSLSNLSFFSYVTILSS